MIQSAAKMNGTETAMENLQPKILKNVCHSIGKTPMIRLNNIPQSAGVECEVLAKCEFLSAGGSHKDRIAIRMIEDAERAGLIKEGYTIIEPTSGNTGVAVAMVCAVKGYKCILVMPEKMSTEKNDTMHALGATIIRTPNCPFGSPESHICTAERLQKEIPNSYILDQYSNEGNPNAHYDETAEEILNQCDGRIDMVVIGAGTGGIITGIGRKFKEKCPSCEIVGVDPEGSIMAEPAALNENAGKFWEIEGIGHDFVPQCLDRSVVDRWVKVEDKDSLVMARRIISEEGLLVGGSSGSAVFGAIKAIKEAGLGAGARCVVIIPDSIRNYMTKFLSDNWMLERDFFSDDEFQNLYPSWWSTTLSTLPQLTEKFKEEITICGDKSVSHAISLLRENNKSQLAVVDENGFLQGVVTLDSLIGSLLSKTTKLQGESLVANSIQRQFKRVQPEVTLGKLSVILKSHPFVAVVKNPVAAPKKEIFLGILRQVDLLSHLNQNEL